VFQQSAATTTAVNKRCRPAVVHSAVHCWHAAGAYNWIQRSVSTLLTYLYLTRSRETTPVITAIQLLLVVELRIVTVCFCAPYQSAFALHYITKVYFHFSDKHLTSVSKKYLTHVGNVIVCQGTEMCSGDELTRRIEQLPLNMHWAILMLSGGHFAAAVFKRWLYLYVHMLGESEKSLGLSDVVDIQKSTCEASASCCLVCFYFSNAARHWMYHNWQNILITLLSHRTTKYGAVLFVCFQLWHVHAFLWWCTAADAAAATAAVLGQQNTFSEQLTTKYGRQ